jgi:hypothetical protein
MEEARANMHALICELLPEAAARVDEDMFREGLCMKGKIFEEAEFHIDESGEVVSLATLAFAL